MGFWEKATKFVSAYVKQYENNKRDYARRNKSKLEAILRNPSATDEQKAKAREFLDLLK